MLYQQLSNTRYQVSFKLIIVLSNSQTCTFPLTGKKIIVLLFLYRQTVTEHPELFQFRMGTNNLLANSENMQQRRAVAMYMHPDYNIKTSNLSNDVALFKMESPFNITDYVRTVCLPKKNMTGLSNATVVTVTGWGQTENGKCDTKLFTSYNPHPARKQFPQIISRY